MRRLFREGYCRVTRFASRGYRPVYEAGDHRLRTGVIRCRSDLQGVQAAGGVRAHRPLRAGSFCHDRGPGVPRLPVEGHAQARRRRSQRRSRDSGPRVRHMDRHALSEERLQPRPVTENLSLGRAAHAAHRVRLSSARIHISADPGRAGQRRALLQRERPGLHARAFARFPGHRARGGGSRAAEQVLHHGRHSRPHALRPDPSPRRPGCAGAGCFCHQSRSRPVQPWIHRPARGAHAPLLELCRHDARGARIRSGRRMPREAAVPER